MAMPYLPGSVWQYGRDSAVATSQRYRDEGRVVLGTCRPLSSMRSGFLVHVGRLLSRPKYAQRIRSRRSQVDMERVTTSRLRCS